MTPTLRFYYSPYKEEIHFYFLFREPCHVDSTVLERVWRPPPHTPLGIDFDPQVRAREFRDSTVVFFGLAKSGFFFYDFALNTGAGTGGSVERDVGRHEPAEHVRAASAERRPRRLFVPERVLAGGRPKRPVAAGHVLDSRRSVFLGPQQAGPGRPRLLYGRRRGVGDDQLQTRPVRYVLAPCGRRIAVKIFAIEYEVKTAPEYNATRGVGRCRFRSFP